MIDQIYFLGESLVPDVFLTEIFRIIAPEKSNFVDLSKNTLDIGDKIIELFNKYDIIYLDLRRILITDMGMGILQKLGFRFLDEYNEELDPIGTNLYQIDKIERDREFNENKKLRLILSRPRQNHTNMLCGLSFKNSLFEGEMLLRSIHNLMYRLKSQGYYIDTDLKAYDSGGMSTLLSCVLRDKDITYFFEDGIEPDKFGEEINYKIFGGKNGKSRL